MAIELIVILRFVNISRLLMMQLRFNRNQKKNDTTTNFDKKIVNILAVLPSPMIVKIIMNLSDILDPIVYQSAWLNN